eukprot:153593-Pelagomonas_calceolata.AAC.2
MGREPLGLPLPGKFQTWLPWPAQPTPCHGISATLANKQCRQPCSVKFADAMQSKNLHLLPWCVDEGASGVWSAADCLRGA